MNVYPHMCRDGHIEIGHSDSEHEQCPLCRCVATLTDALEYFEAREDASTDSGDLRGNKEMHHASEIRALLIGLGEINE